MVLLWLTCSFFRRDHRVSVECPFETFEHFDDIGLGELALEQQVDVVAGYSVTLDSPEHLGFHADVLQVAHENLCVIPVMNPCALRSGLRGSQLFEHNIGWNPRSRGRDLCAPNSDALLWHEVFSPPTLGTQRHESHLLALVFNLLADVGTIPCTAVVLQSLRVTLVPQAERLIGKNPLRRGAKLPPLRCTECSDGIVHLGRNTLATILFFYIRFPNATFVLREFRFLENLQSRPTDFLPSPIREPHVVIFTLATSDFHIIDVEVLGGFRCFLGKHTIDFTFIEVRTVSALLDGLIENLSPLWVGFFNVQVVVILISVELLEVFFELRFAIFPGAIVNETVLEHGDVNKRRLFLAVDYTIDMPLTDVLSSELLLKRSRE